MGLPRERGLIFACGITKCTGQLPVGVPVAASSAASAVHDPGYEACFGLLNRASVMHWPYVGPGAWEIHVPADQYDTAREALLRDPRCRCFAFDPD